MPVGVKVFVVGLRFVVASGLGALFVASAGFFVVLVRSNVRPGGNGVGLCPGAGTAG